MIIDKIIVLFSQRHSDTRHDTTQTYTFILCIHIDTIMFMLSLSFEPTLICPLNLRYDAITLKLLHYECMTERNLHTTTEHNE